MRELIYTSLPTQKGIDVKSILDVARVNNPAKGITGFLCFDGHRFLQILEGEKTVIQELYASIERDTRHKDIELLHQGDISERSFSEWSMAYDNLPLGMLDTLAENIGVMSMMEAKDHIAGIDESYGARLFGLFFHSAYNTPDEKSA